MAYLVNIANQKVESIDTAKEIVQDVFMNLYLRRNYLQVTSSLKAYLFTALQNKIYNHYRQQLSRNKHENNAGNNLKVVTDHPQDDYDAKELQELLDEKINELPPQCKKVFLMSRNEQLSHKEIAERLNISPNTVDQHIQKALKILRASVAAVKK